MKALVSMRGRAGPRFSPAFRVAAHGWSAAIPAGSSTAIDMILGARTNYRSASIRFWIDKALAEMARVLRPGGYLILCDIAHRDSYVLRLQQLGITQWRMVFSPVLDRFLAAVSFGSFRPYTIFARGPG